MLHNHPFEILTVNRKERIRVITELFTTLLKADYEISILCKKKTKNENLTFQNENNGYYLYLVNQKEQINDMASFLNQCSNWHHNVFVILIGDKGLNESIVTTESLDYSLSIPEMQVKLTTSIPGYIFPVDDELIFHGTENIKKLFSK